MQYKFRYFAEIWILDKIDAVFLGCRKLSPGFSALGSKILLGILGLC